jgi:endonuclease YncB( thermonuclease family)
MLAHIELPDRTKLNEALLEAGLAKIEDRWPHALLTRYAQLELAAKRRGAGIWSPSTHGDQSH